MMSIEEFEEFDRIECPPPTIEETTKRGNCYLCGTTRVNGECPAYHPNDADHLFNRNLIRNGLRPIPIEPVTLDKTEWGPCWQCGAPTDSEGRCTRENSFFHEEPYSSWMDSYHSQNEMENAPEPTFLIEGFLQKDIITAIAAPVAQRKTIIAANVVRAVLTGDPLFDHFKVSQRATRVLYLCPEMGLISFAKRIRNLGLMQYVGKRLFCTTMNSERLSLSELTADELEGALVVIDTAVRFVEGDENSSEHMKVFASECFRLIKDGAASVLVLFHSPKGTKEASELSVENALRGSGELGAFIAQCWATRLQDPDSPWDSASYLKCVKQRDFASDPFEVKSDNLGRLRIVTLPGPNVILSGKPVGFPANQDGREEEALQIIKDNPALSITKLLGLMTDRGIKRSRSWIGYKKADVLGTGVKSSAGASTTL